MSLYLTIQPHNHYILTNNNTINIIISPFYIHIASIALWVFFYALIISIIRITIQSIGQLLDVGLWYMVRFFIYLVYP